MNFFIFGISLVALLSLVGCNSVFPENKSSSTMESRQQLQEKVCVDFAQKSSQKAKQTTKTYKIIGE